jgi:hypothetical protein
MDPLERPWLPPEFADAVRDARALVRCAQADDYEEGMRVMLDAVTDDPRQAGRVLSVLAGMAAELLSGCDGHWLAGFLRD